MTRLLSAQDVAALEKERHKMKKELYLTILEQFSKKIKWNFEVGNKVAHLQVPPYMLGFPRYDHPTAVAYLHRQLQRLGYHVTLVSPIDFEVTWGNAPPVEPPPLETQLPDYTFDGLTSLNRAANMLRKKGR